MTAAVEFVESLGAYSGVDNGGRAWHISACFTGWRLEFQDAGDPARTYAGIHPSLDAAQREASRVTGRGTRHAPGGGGASTR